MEAFDGGEDEIVTDRISQNLNLNPSCGCRDCDTLTHLLKACLGSGILAMPDAFRNAGLTAGVIGTVLVGIICTHCSYILVQCAHELYYRTRVTAMSFADVGQVAFANGPPWAQKFSKMIR